MYVLYSCDVLTCCTAVMYMLQSGVPEVVQNLHVVTVKMKSCFMDGHHSLPVST